MPGGRPILALLSLILVAGSIALTFLILLAGAVDGNPVYKFYFLQADTSSIANAPSTSRWTFWNVCSTTNGHNSCGKVHPAYPFDPPKNFGTKSNVPKQFIGTHTYYYLTRFMFAFVLIYLFFAVCSLLCGVLALCTRIGSFLSGFLAMIAAFFSAVTSALMTAAYVKGRNNFRSNGNAAQIGKYAFAFLWASTFCLFLASVFYCIGGGISGRDKTTYSSSRSRFRGRRTRSTRSQGSFAHNKELSV